MKITDVQEQTLFTLDEVKKWLKVQNDYEDAIILRLIDASIESFERELWRSFREKTIEIIFTDEPEWVILPQSPVEEITKVERWTGTEWLEVADFEAADPDGYIYTGNYPTVRFTYTAGVYDNADVNNMLLDMIAAKYDSRPEDPTEVKYILSRARKHKRWFVK
jgi:hypothetical protein